MAQGPGASHQVGKVSVRVVPDTSRFRQELAAQLKKIEQSLRVEIPTELNTAAARAQMQQLKRQLSGQSVTLGVRLDQRGGLARLRRDFEGFRGPLTILARPLEWVAAGLARMSRASYSAAAGVVRVRRAVVGATADLARMSATAARLGVRVLRDVLRLENLEAAWKGIQRGASAAAGAIRKIPELPALARDLALSQLQAARLAGVRFAGFVRSLGQAKTYTDALYNGMQRVARFTVRVADGFARLRSFKFSDLQTTFVRLGTTLLGAGRRVAQFGRNLFDLGRTAARGLGRVLDTGIEGVGRAVSAVFTAMSSGAMLAANALRSVTTTGLLAFAVLSLLAPVVGLVAGVLAGLPSLVLGFAAALGAIALGMDGIKAAFNNSLRPAFDQLRESLSANFEQGLTPVFQQLNQLMPTLESGLLKVSNGLISLMQGFTNVVTSARGMEQIDTILQRTGQFLADLRPMVEDGTRAFLNLAEAGAKQFGLLSGVLNNFAREFREMTERVISSGVFDSAMQGLAQVTGSLLSGFTKIFESGLGALADLGEPMSRLVDTLTDAFVAAMPVFTAFSSVIADVFSTALAALTPVFKAIGPPLQEFARTLGNVVVRAIEKLEPVLTPLIQQLGTFLVNALRTLTPLIQPLVQFFSQLASIFGQFLLSALQQIQPLFGMLVQFALDLFAALQPLLPALLELAQAIFAAMLEVLQQLMPHLLRMAQEALPLILEAVVALTPALVDIIGRFAEMAGWLGDLISKVVDYLAPAFQFLLDVVREVWPQIQGVVEGALQIIQGIIDVVMGIITGDWERAWNGLKRIFEGAWKAIKEAVSGAISGLVSLVGEIPGKLLNALGNLGEVFYQAGKSIIEGLINGIRAMFDRAVQTVRDLIGRIRQYLPFSPAKKGPLSGRGYTLYSGMALASDFAKGIESEIPRVTEAMDKLMSHANGTATARWRGRIESDNYGIAEAVEKALSGWYVEIDANGITKLVNKTNTRRARRG